MSRYSGLFAAAVALLGLMAVDAAAQQRPRSYQRTGIRRGPAVTQPQLAPARTAPATKIRSPRNQCRMGCRRSYSMCVRRAGRDQGGCFKGRRACYRKCRQTLPPTTPANQPVRR